MDDARDRIEQRIGETVAGYAADPGVHTTWRTPLVAYAAAHDPLFRHLKEIISPSHATPQELLPDARTVIVYFLPFTEDIARSNQAGATASRTWALAYVETNRLLDLISHQLAGALESLGYRTALLPPTHTFDEERLVSDWSHKHVAYIAGLGAFGRHHMLITDQGCCGRLGSIVTTALIKPTPRKAAEACLGKVDGSCTACIRRCPVGALDAEPFDRRACYDVCLNNGTHFEDLGLADVCGKCVSVVPCSFTDPVARAAARSPLDIGAR